jgi:hypothetical protein
MIDKIIAEGRERLTQEQQDLLRQLDARIRALKSELERIEELLKQKPILEEKIRWYQGVFNDLLESAGVSILETPAKEEEIQPGEFAVMSITDACEVILRRAGKPLTTSELYDRLLKGGKRFAATSPLGSITGPLRRDGKRRFIHRRAGRENLWSLRAWVEGEMRDVTKFSEEQSKEEKEPSLTRD